MWTMVVGLVRRHASSALMAAHRQCIGGRAALKCVVVPLSLAAVLHHHQPHAARQAETPRVRVTHP